MAGARRNQARAALISGTSAGVPGSGHTSVNQALERFRHYVASGRAAFRQGAAGSVPSQPERGLTAANRRGVPEIAVSRPGVCLEALTRASAASPAGTRAHTRACRCSQASASGALDALVLGGVRSKPARRRDDDRAVEGRVAGGARARAPARRLRHPGRDRAAGRRRRRRGHGARRGRSRAPSTTTSAYSTSRGPGGTPS